MTNSSIKCIIFDCDGTLVDSERLCQRALVDVFAHFGCQLDLDECMNRFQGGKLSDILLETREKCGLDVSLEILEPMYRKACETAFNAELQPIPGTPQLLSALQQQGIDVCVASNGPVKKMTHTLGLTKLLPFFQDRLFSAFEIQVWKPEPDLLHYAAMQMGYSVNECLFVDDTIPGISAGINANMRSIYFRPQRVNNKPIKHPLVTTVESMPQLAQWLQV
ncbi:6-phosphogluconate phosphatase [Thaumasiovibrio sp. DFM-14]|uniref:6-phosphogluconate phosphatase n=1 Tax=Thaumasiovibrio sp. DFM-14 TaxID=3384792 RepID=UPI0039A3B5B8